MIEHWVRTEVSGEGPEIMARETVLHKRGQDPLTMAMRRNPMLPGCVMIRQNTTEAFTLVREDERIRRRAEIPRDDRQGEEFDW